MAVKGGKMRTSRIDRMFLDLETIPPAEEHFKTVLYLCKKKYAKEYKKKDIDKDASKITQDSPEFDEFLRSMSLDGSFGRILCAGYAINDDAVKVICNDENERKTLEEFWKIAEKMDLYVGHNIIDFDMRFVIQRSVVHKIKPPKYISFARYRNQPMYDTMYEWAQWAYGNKISLEQLALALGIPSPKDGIDGSQVYDFYLDGKIDEICDYAGRDVDTLRNIYWRMIFRGQSV